MILKEISKKNLSQGSDSLKQTQTVDEFFKSSMKKDFDGTFAKKEIEINPVDTINEDTERGLI